MKKSYRIAVVTAAVAIALLIAAALYVLAQNNIAAERADNRGAPSAVRPNSLVLDEGDSNAVTVVEFLDFECEACAAFYPVVEELRTKYRGDITYVVRYFPLPGHSNSATAALAAEAAAQQGRFEDMYNILFRTQATWGEQTDSQAPLFRAMAEQLQLDMDLYDAAVEDPLSIARIQYDLEDGRELGVSATPTFFVEGYFLTLREVSDLEDAIVEAIANKTDS